MFLLKILTTFKWSSFDVQQSSKTHGAREESVSSTWEKRWAKNQMWHCAILLLLCICTDLSISVLKKILCRCQALAIPWDWSIHLDTVPLLKVFNVLVFLIHSINLLLSLLSSGGLLVNNDSMMCQKTSKSKICKMLLGQCYTKAVKTQLLLFFGQHIYTFRTKAGNICIRTSQGKKVLCSQHHNEIVLWIIGTLTSIICISNLQYISLLCPNATAIIMLQPRVSVNTEWKNRSF